MSSLGYLFIHVPKTGGNAIQSVLSRYADDEVVRIAPHHDGHDRFEVRNPKFRTVKHSSLKEYRSTYPPAMFEALRRVSVVRNTFDRVRSHYFSPHRGEVQWSESDFLEFLDSGQVKPLAHYWCLEGQSFSEAVGSIDVLLGFETLGADFAKFTLAVIGQSLKLPTRNVGPRHGRCLQLPNNAIELIASRFREEIEYFRFAPTLKSSTAAE